jgi:nitrite reductase/ring-hydroxylating ferredoxin subunit
MGGDLAGGWIDDQKLVCPLHSLPFDPETGASPCHSLPALRRYACHVRDGRVHVDTERDTERDEIVARDLES